MARACGAIDGTKLANDGGATIQLRGQGKYHRYPGRDSERQRRRFHSANQDHFNSGRSNSLPGGTGAVHTMRGYNIRHPTGDWRLEMADTRTDLSNGTVVCYSYTGIPGIEAVPGHVAGRAAKQSLKGDGHV